jgi:hypothetical protein
MEALKNRSLAAVAAMLILCAAQETRGMNAYLKQTGPCPLRFSLFNFVPASFALPKSLVERQAPTNTAQVATVTNTSTGTNAVASTLPPVPAPPTNPSVQTAIDTQNSSVPKPPASDLLVVSPQMLTEFFKPVANETNSPGDASVPLPVGFTPPSAPPSSRATYNSP